MPLPIEWREEPHKGLTISKDKVVAKGPLENIKQFLNVKNKVERGIHLSESNIPIRLTEKDLGTTEWESPPMKIGLSYYNSKRIYQILEEMYDKDLLLSTGRRVKKEFLGKIIWVKAIIIKVELIPIIFYKDEETAYVLSPRREPEEE